MQFLGQAAFSKAVKCLDQKTNEIVCLKIIQNNKDYIDQSFDEIKLLNLLNSLGDVDQFNILKIIEYFYFQEHLFIVTEILKVSIFHKNNSIG